MAVFDAFLTSLLDTREKSKTFRLEGKIEGTQHQLDLVYLQYRPDEERKTDSVRVMNGKYRFSGIVADPVLGALRIKFKADGAGNKIAMVSGRDMVTFFLQAGKI